LPFDSTLKDLVQTYLRDFETELRLSGPRPVNVLNVDLSTISAASDVVFGYGDPPKRIIDLNLQSSRDPELSDRLLLYNALLRFRFRAPVHSIVVLLRASADDPKLTGRLRYQAWPRRGKMDFTLEVVRLWRRPVRGVLKGGLGTLPLAPLYRLPKIPVKTALASLIQQIEERLRRETTPERATKLLTATFILSGLRVSQETAVELFKGVRAMRESTTYQYILDEGRTEEARKILLRLGRQRFGAASRAVEATINGISDLARLERMSDRILQVSSWAELLEAP